MFESKIAVPALTSARDVMSRALQGLRFPDKVRVSEAARRHRVLRNPGAYSGPWGDSPHDMRCLDRPMDCLATTSHYAIVAVMGGSQQGKSEIGNNWQLHTIEYDQADTLFVAPSKDLINSYVTTQFDKMLDLSVDNDGRPGLLRQRQLGGVSSDNINLKRFRGCDFHFLWPGGPTFRAKPFPRGRMDDFDEFGLDIANQGDALGLMEGRMGSFSAYGRTKIYVNSTPVLGKNKGIEALVASGTDERWYVDCLACAHPFTLTFDRLDYDQSGTPEDAAASAAVVCPECGGAHAPTDKRALMGTGRWVGRGESAVSRQEVEEGKAGELVASKRATFRLTGLMGFRPWSQIASLARAAEISFALDQDPAAFKSFDQTVIGRNYVPRDQGEPAVTEDALYKRAKRSSYRMREVPPGAVCLIATIDQQSNRFEVAVWAWGKNFRCWLVDRFAVLTVMENGAERPLRPFTRPEDWSVLHERVLSRTYPLAAAPHLRMRIMNTSVDTGGLDAATDNAFTWWHAMVKGDVGSGRPPLPPTALTLLKGGNRPEGRLLPPPTIDAKRQIKDAPQAELFVPNVNRYKDTADVRLKREDEGPGAIGFPNDLPQERDGSIPYLAELRAETNVNGQWTREPHRANETWDLYIQSCAVITRFGGTDASLAWVPEWARPPKDAPRVLPAPATQVEEVAAPEQIGKVALAPRRTGPRRGIRMSRPR